MDHLPAISNAQFSLPIVPFLVQDWCCYDGQGLQDFDKRAGFDFKDKAQDDAQASSFFQAWLYFGTLTEILAVHDVPVQYDDFCKIQDGSRLLTTRHLPDYLAAWVANAARKSPLVLENRIELHWYSAGNDQKVAAGKFAEALYNVLSKACDLVRQLSPHQNSILAAVWDATIVLLWTLETATSRSYRASNVAAGFASSYLSPILGLPSRLLPRLLHPSTPLALEDSTTATQDQTLQNIKWCPKEQHALMTIFDSTLPVLMCCLMLRSNQDERLHSQCSIKKCLAYQVEDSQYVTEHVLPGCPCHFVDAGNVYSGRALSTSKISRLAEMPKKVPAITYSDARLRIAPIIPVKTDIAKQVAAYAGGSTKYVAFSHVWAQGRGNPYRNALPHCQLENLQKLANRMFPGSVEPIPFWIDTMCIPVDPVARRLGIESMEHVYKCAPVIVVLDNDLMRIQSRTLSPEEIALRIACSTWARRLWTLQEGLYQKRVFYRFADAVQNFYFLNDIVRRQYAFPGRARTLPRGHSLHQVMDDPPLYGEKGPLMRNAHKALSFWAVIASFFKQVDILSEWQGVNNEMFLGEILKSMITRTTSKVEDESLVFASASSRLPGSTQSLLKVDASERYRAFFKPRYGYQNIPSYLIFFDQRRYEEDGSRWIPRSLLTQEMAVGGITSMPATGENGTAWATGGLRVRYPGVVFESMSLSGVFPAQFAIDAGTGSFVCDVYHAGTREPVVGRALQYPAMLFPRDAFSRRQDYVGVLVDIADWSDVLKECQETTEMAYTLGNTFNVRKYGKYTHFNIRARHEGLVKLRPEEVNELQTLPKLQYRHIVSEKSSTELHPALDRLPRWLIL